MAVLPERIELPFGSDGQWQLHHAAPFAAVRWTNIYDPARFVLCGDVISGEVAPVFGPGVLDVDLRRKRGQSWRFSHTRYWTVSARGRQEHIKELRDALDLPYRNEA
jgi:hypothetical protein